MQLNLFFLLSCRATSEGLMDPVHGHHRSTLPLLPSSSSTFPILAITALGILLISAVLLLSYYVFVAKWCLNLPSHRRGGHSIPPEVCGLEPAIIRSIPVVMFVNSGQDHCAVCLSDFRGEERIKVLPRCSHHFHIDCIDTWLQFNINCPLCRASITAPVPFNPLAMALAPQFSHPHDAFLEIRDEERKMELFGSRGDECIDVQKEEEEKLRLQPMRRSFSVDSSRDMQLHVALQRILQQSSHEGSSGGCGRFRRSVLSFGRSSRSSVLPLQMEL